MSLCAYPDMLYIYSFKGDIIFLNKKHHSSESLHEKAFPTFWCTSIINFVVPVVVFSRFGCKSYACIEHF